MKILNTMIALALFLVAMTAVTADDLQQGIVLEEFEIDRVELDPNTQNFLSLERGEIYDVRVRFTPLVDVRNAVVRIYTSGYEYGDIEDIYDRAPVDDYDANVSYTVDLELNLPELAEEDNYVVYVKVSDRSGQEFSESFNIKIDVPRNDLRMEDVILNPSGAVRAGSALLATVRLENTGERDQDDVRVNVAIPALGVSGTAYIDEIRNDGDEEETREIFMRIPRCSDPGNYDVMIDVQYSQRHRTLQASKTITVLEDETCGDDEVVPSTITLSTPAQNVEQGQTAVYPISVTNTGRSSNTYLLSVPSTDWATVTVTPTSMLVVPAGQTQVAFVNVQVAEEAQTGAQSLVATVASGDERQDLNLVATVTESQAPKKSTARSVFEVILIVLVVLLVILGVIIGLAHLRRKEQTETYY